MFDPIEEPRAPRRAANDDRETIGQILQAIQKGRPARNVYTLATIFAGVWLVGCGLLTVGFLPSLQAAMGQSGGVLVLGGLAALFFAPVLLFYFLASLAWRGQEMRMIAQSMAQVAIRFSEPEGCGVRLDGHGRSGDPPRSRRDGRRRRTRDRARRRTRNAGGQ